MGPAGGAATWALMTNGTGSGGISPAIIGAAAAAVVVVILGGGFVFWRRSKARKQQLHVVHMSDQVSGTPPMGQLPALDNPAKSDTYPSGLTAAGQPPQTVPPQVHQPQVVPVSYNTEGYYPPPPPVLKPRPDGTSGTPQNPQDGQAMPHQVQNPQTVPVAHLNPLDPQQYQEQDSHFQQEQEQQQQQYQQFLLQQQQYAQFAGAAVPGNPHSDMNSSVTGGGGYSSPYMSDSTTIAASSPFMYGNSGSVATMYSGPQSYPSSPLATSAATTMVLPGQGRGQDMRHPQLYAPVGAPQMYQGQSSTVPTVLHDESYGYVRAPQGRTQHRA
ncbi:hypothetical protein BGZ83_007394 [Gryganskiella cystojenkinii]|nr:hypothetical protein BGZ83_007394 [Gryganskiella cystojenkinii]